MSFTLPNLPEGYQATPNEFAQWIAENLGGDAGSESSGFLQGQIGGVEPAVNVGLFIDGTTIKVWDGVKYVPIATNPVGAILPYPSGSVSPPTDHLFCDGQALQKDDYEELYDVIGDSWKASTDAGDVFRVPDLRGRSIAGSGIGDYDPKADPAITDGKMANHNMGEYYGSEWAQWKTTTQPNAPTGRVGVASTKNRNLTTYTGIIPPRAYMQFIIKVR